MTGEARSGLRNAANTERYGLRKAEARMAAMEHQLERDLETFSVSLADSEKRIEAAFRVQHSGHEPERPLSWRAPESPRSRSCG